MGIVSCVLSLFGCNRNPIKPEGELTSVSISQSHMDRTDCYSFGAYKKNDTYNLNARCMIEKGDNDYEDVELENISITKEEFKQFEELDKKYDFFSLRKPNKIEKNIFFVVDETITNFSLSYGDESFSLYTSGDCYNEVHDCFVALAEKYNETIN
ncbi:hypothetical protein [Ruminococcus sp.]|uniref:hypothetical protein n=1 Tax=Ruminococcus sp. TaxID=41978 RepID=UPI0025D6D614|nr:hypothetical protein [Ruminococcus sp.]MCI6617150.1 hypothetical protein [Ruminococcus sp.]